MYFPVDLQYSLNLHFGWRTSSVFMTDIELAHWLSLAAQEYGILPLPSARRRPRFRSHEIFDELPHFFMSITLGTPTSFATWTLMGVILEDASTVQSDRRLLLLPTILSGIRLLVLVTDDLHPLCSHQRYISIYRETCNNLLGYCFPVDACLSARRT